MQVIYPPVEKVMGMAFCSDGGKDDCYCGCK